MAKIAVFSKDEELAPFLECNMVRIYEKQEDGWKLIETSLFSPVMAGSIGGLRNEMKAVLPLADGADAVICTEIAGIPFAEFDRAGYCIFSAPEIGSQVFDGVMEDIEASDEKKKIRDEIIKNARPAETQTPGIYFLDLVLLQKECPEVSSKKALREFLDTVPFLELRVDCAHVPPWLEQESRFDIKTRNQDGVAHLVLTKKQC